MTPVNDFLFKIYTFLPKKTMGNGKIDKEGCHRIQTLKWKLDWRGFLKNKNVTESLETHLFYNWLDNKTFNSITTPVDVQIFSHKS